VPSYYHQLCTSHGGRIGRAGNEVFNLQMNQGDLTTEKHVSQDFIITRSLLTKEPMFRVTVRYRDLRESRTMEKHPQLILDLDKGCYQNLSSN